MDCGLCVVCHHWAAHPSGHDMCEDSQSQSANQLHPLGSLHHRRISNGRPWLHALRLRSGPHRRCRHRRHRHRSHRLCLPDQGRLHHMPRPNVLRPLRLRPLRLLDHHLCCNWEDNHDPEPCLFGIWGSHLLNISGDRHPGDKTCANCHLLVTPPSQMMMGGHKFAISPEEYVFAAIAIYLDILNLFLKILRLMAIAKRK